MNLTMNRLVWSGYENEIPLPGILWDAIYFSLSLSPNTHTHTHTHTEPTSSPLSLLLIVCVVVGGVVILFLVGIFIGLYFLCYYYPHR